MSTIKYAALCAALALTVQTNAAELPLPKDGWASWQVEAVDDSPAWCCWSSWDDNKADMTACKLDGERQGYGTRDHNKTDSVRVYARFAGGKLERVRALAAACPVETKTPIQKLDNVSTDDSARWLTSLAKTGRKDSDDDVLSALALHRGGVAMTALTGLAQNDQSVETRKQAIFWLAMLRGTAGADVTSASMFNDKDAEVRKHAEFALTQSKSLRIAADLIKAGTDDADSDVRAQAWFWLAQSGSANAEAALIAAAKKDPNDHVREQAVFALSQLPDERAATALIAAAEDRTLSTEQRKRALFWLAQSDSKGAQNYLDKVLTGNNTH